MNYNIYIDQMFAVESGLTLTQVAALSAFLTLPTWTKTLAMDGAVWYMYSDEKMSEDFPLLFGVPKRCYKNISDLCAMGFVELTKIGGEKYVRFTERCAEWGKEKVRNRTESPKTDSEKSEIGLSHIVSNVNNNTNNYKTNDNTLFSLHSNSVKGTAEKLCLFADSKFADYEIFAEHFKGDEFSGIDVGFYFHQVMDWSAAGGKKKKDWIATVRNWIRSDIQAGKVKRLTNSTSLVEQYMEDRKRWQI